jgi:hypothetical protein
MTINNILKNEKDVWVIMNRVRMAVFERYKGCEIDPTSLVDNYITECLINNYEDLINISTKLLKKVGYK